PSQTRGMSPAPTWSAPTTTAPTAAATGATAASSGCVTARQATCPPLPRGRAGRVGYDTRSGAVRHHRAGHRGHYQPPVGQPGGGEMGHGADLDGRARRAGCGVERDQLAGFEVDHPDRAPGDDRATGV